VIDLTYFHGLSFRDIADVMNCPVGGNADDYPEDGQDRSKEVTTYFAEREKERSSKHALKHKRISSTLKGSIIARAASVYFHACPSLPPGSKD
jgi:hypothetical protein